MKCSLRIISMESLLNAGRRPPLCLLASLTRSITRVIFYAVFVPVVGVGCYNNASPDGNHGTADTPMENKVEGKQRMTFNDSALQEEFEAIENDLSHHNVTIVNKEGWSGIIWTDGVGHLLWDGIGIAIRIIAEDQRVDRTPSTKVFLELRQVIGGNEHKKVSLEPEFRKVKRIKNGWEAKVSDAFGTAKRPGIASNSRGAYLLDVEVLIENKINLKAKDLPIEYVSKKEMMEGNKEYWKRSGHKEKFEVLPQLRDEYKGK